MQNDLKEEKIQIARVLDAMEKCRRESTAVSTDFLDMKLQGMAFDEIKYSGVRFSFDGGYDGAERRLITFFPDWADEYYFENNPEDYPMEILRVTHKMGGKELSHRDYLGSLLGLGLSRSKTGDIIVYREGADIFITKDMEEFLLANYFKAGRTELELSVHPVNEVNLSSQKFEYIKDTVASLRLDSFLACAYRSSRGKAQEAIRQGLVFVNNSQCMKPDAEIKEKDHVVLRGKGKCILDEIGGNSRKDRIFISIKKFI